MKQPAWYERDTYRTADGRVIARLRVAFKYRAPGESKVTRHREYTGLEDTRANRKAWQPNLDELGRDLILTRYGLGAPVDLAKYFPRTAERKTAPMFRPVSTVGEVIEQFMEMRERAGLGRKRVLEQQRGRFEKHILLHDIAKLPLADFRDNHVIAWLGDMREKGLAASSINTVFAPFKMAMTAAWERELIPTRIDPMSRVRLLATDPARPRPLMPGDLLRLFSVCEAQQRLFYIIEAFSGMRPAEAYALPWEHVDFKARVIRIRQQLIEHNDGHIEITDGLKTDSSKRDIEMHEIVRWALAQLQPLNRLRAASCKVYDHPAGSHAGKLVFVNRERAPLQSSPQDKAWARALKRARLGTRRLYELRHTFTFLMLAATRAPGGEEPYTMQWVASQLGHVDLEKINEVYGRWRNQPARERIDLENLFARIKALPASAKAATAMLKAEVEANTMVGETAEETGS